MVQTTRKRTGRHSQVVSQAVPICLGRHGQLWRWLWNTCPQGHMGTTRMIMWHPLVQDVSQVMLGERDQKI